MSTKNATVLNVLSLQGYYYVRNVAVIPVIMKGFKYTNKIKGTERKMQKCLFRKNRNKHFNAFVFCFNSFALLVANHITNIII